MSAVATRLAKQRRLLTVDGVRAYASEVLGRAIPRSRIERLMRDGFLPYEQVGPTICAINVDDVDVLIREQRLA